MSPRTPQSQGGPPLRIVILGTGEVSQVLTPALLDRGHEVLIGTRDPDRTATSNTGHRQLSQQYPQVSLLTLKEAATAKARVADLLQDLGWEDVLLDLGGIITSRATEMFLRLWLDTAQSLGTSDFGFRLVR